MNRVFAYSSFLFLNGILFAQHIEKPAPSWVMHRPVSSSRYIGIGVAEKAAGANYIMEAKKNALYDLASEIKVNISSNSMLYSYQNNNQFNQTYNSLIKLSNTENIEGFHLADTYENDRQYWVYYYLDKEEYLRRKEQKKQMILQQATQWLSAAVTELSSGNFAQTLFLRIKAMGLLIPYLNEEIKLNPQQSGGVSNMVELTQLIQQQLNIPDISLTSENLLTPLQPSYAERNLLVKHAEGGNMNFNQTPFKIEFNNEELRLKNNHCKVNENVIKLEIEKVLKYSGEINLDLIIDLHHLTRHDSIAYSGARLLTQVLNIRKYSVTFKTEPVKVLIDYQLKNYSSPVSVDSLSEWSYLINEYLRHPAITLMEYKEVFVSPPKAKAKSVSREKETAPYPKPDYVIVVSVNTFLHPDNGIFHENTRNYLAELKGDFILKNAKGEEVFRFPLSGMYGYDKDKKTAGLKAYESIRKKNNIHEALFHIQRKMIRW